MLDLLFNGGKITNLQNFVKFHLFSIIEDSDGSRRLKIDADEVHFTRTVKKHDQVQHPLTIT